MATQTRATFARMQDATAADYEPIISRAVEHAAGLADRLLAAVDLLGTGDAGYAVSRLDHSLQSATRALRDERDDAYVTMCLVHDIGDTLAPNNHGEIAAAVLEPFVRSELTWITRHHPVFQFYYYGARVGVDPNLRERYRGHELFDATVEFCEKYDENCFDANYDALPLDHFRPIVHRVMAQPLAGWRSPDLGND
jgi:predicted HD phosphohydrolase